MNTTHRGNDARSTDARFAALPHEFAEPLQRLGDDLAPLASHIVWRAQTGSTNADATVLAEAGAPEGCVVLADAQTAGRGRLGRSWSSPAGAGIYASVLFRPEPPVARMLSLAAGVAIAEGIEAATGLAPTVKWPNDIFVTSGGGQAERKVAGILAEAGLLHGATWVVVGFGINVLPSALPAAVATRATSLETELGRPIHRGELLAICLARLAGQYAALRAGRHRDVVGAWKRRASATFGRRIEWDEDGTSRQGIVKDVDESGGLLVATTAGTARVVSGEIRWV